MTTTRPAGRLPAGLLVLALAAGAASPAAGQEVLTLEAAVKTALARNEIALATTQNVAAARARVARARSFFLPQITGTGTYTRRPFEVTRKIGDTEIVIQSYNAIAGNVQLNLTIFDSDSLPVMLQARSDRSAAEHSAAETRRQLAFEVSNAYLTTLSTDQVLAATRHRFDYAKQALDAAKARYAAGLVSSNDVTRAELEYATAEMGITQVEGRVQTTALQLSYLLDDREALGKKLEAPEFLLRASEGGNVAVEDLIVQAQGRRLDLSALRFAARGQHALALEPTLRWFPTLSFNTQVRYTNEAGLTGRTTNWNLGLTLGWSIFDGFARNADSRERRAQAVLADLDVKAALRKVELDVRDALVSLENQRAALRQATVAYDVARRNAAETAELYRQGLASVLQVADANVSLFEAEVELVTQRYGLGLSYLNLEAALGLDPFGKEPQL